MPVRLPIGASAELGPQGVRVNCGAPGAVPSEADAAAGVATIEETRKRDDEVIAPITPLRRAGTAEEIAEAIEYVSLAEWTTGAVLDVDGGLGPGALQISWYGNGGHGRWPRRRW